MIVIGGPLQGVVEHIEETVKSNRRLPQRGGIETPHSHILHLSNMDKRASDTMSGARWSGPLAGARRHVLRGEKRVRRVQPLFKREKTRTSASIGDAHTFQGFRDRPDR